MGVEANFLYGYGIDIEEIEWDIEFLKEKYKNKMDEKVNPNGSNFDPTWSEYILELEKHINQTDEDSEDYKQEYDLELSEILEDIDHLFDINYAYDGKYLTFNHKHLMKAYPKAELGMIDYIAKEYSKGLGIKNYEDIKWIEFSFFD